MTECIQERFWFASHFSRRVEAGFTAGQVSSDGGGLLLRQVDRKIKLLERLVSCFVDGRSPRLVRHRLSEMLSQRIHGLALGYEDLNDHEQLRSDPLLGLLSGKRKLEEPLAGKSTLNRLELVGRTKRYHKIGYSAESIDGLLTDLYIESHAGPPAQIARPAERGSAATTRRNVSGGSAAMTRSQSLESIAYQEAGHAGAAWRLGIALGQKGVTIVLNDADGSLGSVSRVQFVARGIEWDPSDRNRVREEKLAQVSLAGEIAQRRYNCCF